MTPPPTLDHLPASILSLVEAVTAILEDSKAEDILTIDLTGKTSLADVMLIASGRSDRHVGAIAEHVIHAVKERGLPTPKVEGMPVCDWVLIDTGDIIVHLFRPEVRGFYNLEKLWGMGRPQEGQVADDVKPAGAKMVKPKAVRAIKTVDATAGAAPARARRKAVPKP